MMENQSKCAECVRRGRPCVGASWESLEKTQEKLESDIHLTEEELSRVLAKLSRLRRTLRHVNSKITEKMSCLAQELGDDVNGVPDGD